MLSFNDLVEIYQIKKPVELIISNEQEVIATKEKIEVHCPESAMIDLPELLALAKLGEKDPLLVSFYFQPDLKKEEEDLCTYFFKICIPLQTVWSWEIMFRYLPSEEFNSQLREPVEIIMNVLDEPRVITSKQIDPHFFIAFMLISQRYGHLIDAEIDFKLVGKYLDEYIALINWTKKFSQIEPNPEVYISLAEAVGFPGKVRIVRTDDEVDYYEVKPVLDK